MADWSKRIEEILDHLGERDVCPGKNQADTVRETLTEFAEEVEKKCREPSGKVFFSRVGGPKHYHISRGHEAKAICDECDEIFYGDVAQLSEQ